MAMIPPRSGSGGGTFKPCPTGLQQLVCCDVIDLGMVTSSYNGEAKTMHKVSLRWQSAKLMSDGKPYLVQKRYTYSLHPKATLRKDLDGWRGKALTDALLGKALALLPAAFRPMITDIFMAPRSAEQLRASRTAVNPTGAPAPTPTDFEQIPIRITDSIAITETLN